jgi:hypothetical protein
MTWCFSHLSVWTRQLGIRLGGFRRWCRGCDSNQFNISFNSGSDGTFTGTLTFAGLSQQAGLSDAPLGYFNINILGATTAAVPESSAWAAMFVGVSTFLHLRRRRCSHLAAMRTRAS